MTNSPSMVRHEPRGPHRFGWSHSLNVTTPYCPDDCPVVLERRSDMSNDTKTTPRIAHSIDDFEIGQRVRWITDKYAGDEHFDAVGTVAERLDSPGNANQTLRVFWTGRPGFDHIDRNIDRGVWMILEDAPEPEVDWPAVNHAHAVESLRSALAAYDGHKRMRPEISRMGIAALPDIIEAARETVRGYDAVSKS